MKQLGMIGAGNMGEALLKGALAGGGVQASEVIVHAHTDQTNTRIAETYDVAIAASNVEVAERATWILLAVKPNLYEQVIREIQEVVAASQAEHPKTIIAIAPGFTIQRIRDLFAIPDLQVMRLMPNTPAAVGKGATGVVCSENLGVPHPARGTAARSAGASTSTGCADTPASTGCAGTPVSAESTGTPTEKEKLLAFVDSFGTHVEVKESLMAAVGSVSGSSPAFVYMLIEALTQGAIQLGMSQKDARKLAAATVEGAGKMALESDKHPAQLRDEVCSPGGTTIEGVKTLETMNFTGAILSAMQAMADKTNRM